MTATNTAHPTLTVHGHDLPIYDDLDAAVLSRLPDLSETDWRDHATNRWENDLSSVHAYDLGDGLTLYVDTYQGVPVSVEVTTDSIERHLGSWNWEDDYARLSQWLAAWDLGGLSVETEADPSWEGECLVWHEPQYYAGTYGAPQAGFATDEAGQPIVFPSYAQALAYRDEYYTAPSGYDGIPACNVLSHGQAGADELTILQA